MPFVLFNLVIKLIPPFALRPKPAGWTKSQSCCNSSWLSISVRRLFLFSLVSFNVSCQIKLINFRNRAPIELSLRTCMCIHYVLHVFVQRMSFTLCWLRLLIYHFKTWVIRSWCTRPLKVPQMAERDETEGFRGGASCCREETTWR